MRLAGGWAAAAARARLPPLLAAPPRGSGGGGGHRGRRAAYASAAAVGVAAPLCAAFTRSDGDDANGSGSLSSLLLSPLLPAPLGPLAAQSLAHLASSGRDVLDAVGDALLGGRGDGGGSAAPPPPPHHQSPYPGEQPPYPHTRRRATDGQRAIAYIAGTNAAVYGLWKLADFGLADERTLSRWLMTSATHLREGVPPRALVTALTSSWSHRDLWHLGLNMLGLWSFTPRLIDGPSTPQHVSVAEGGRGGGGCAVCRVRMRCCWAEDTLVHI
jgi:hypothetical protein